MSCLSASLTRLYKIARASLTLVKEAISICMEHVPLCRCKLTRKHSEWQVELDRVGGLQTCRLGLVCTVGADSFVVLWSSEQPLMTIEGQFLVTSS